MLTRINRQIICVLPDTLWPPYRLIFNGSYCTTEGHFCQVKAPVL